MNRELVIPETPGTLAPTEAGSSLVGWFIAYCHAEVAGAPKTTLKAKKRDFELFLGYFAKMMRSDSIDDWTRSVTLGFVQWLENEANDGKGYAPTTVNGRWPPSAVRPAGSSGGDPSWPATPSSGGVNELP